MALKIHIAATILLAFYTQTPTCIAGATKLNIHADKLSMRNDTEYIKRLLRHAKAAEMSSYMHTEIDPCDNFFEFACGNWAKINPANGMQPRETNFYELLTRNFQHKQLRVLQTPIAHAADGSDSDSSSNSAAAEIKVKNFYSSCEHLSANDKQLKQYKFQLREIIAEFGHMPALLPAGAWRADEFDWLETIAKIQHKYGIDIMLQIGIRPDFDNMTLNKIFIGEPSLQLGTKSMYTGEATQWHRDQYKLKIQQHLMDHLGLTEERAAPTAAEILDFEVELARGLFNYRTAKTLKSLAKLRTADEFAQVYAPVLDLRKYLRLAVSTDFNDTAYEYMLEFQENLARLMKKPQKAQVANYIFYQLISHFFYDVAESPARQQKICLQQTKKFFAKLLDNLVYKKFIREPNTEYEVEMLWQTLKSTFKAQLESGQIDWMSLMTRQLAIEKIQAMRLELTSYEGVNFTAEYENLNIKEKDYIENLKHLYAEMTKKVLASLHTPPQPMEEPLKFSFTPAYVAAENLIKIPVAMLQPNFLWSTNYPKALKFGTLGYLVAHELLHGFDDLGCNFDLQGKENNWWDANTTRAFNERKECFKRQYSQFLYGGKYLPESDLQAENIADNGAVQVAYTAYVSWLKNLANGDGEEAAAAVAKEQTQTESLPLLNYSSQQLFFISFAQFWCNDVNERLKDRVSLVDIHAPAMYRVIGSLSNFKEFSRVFECERGKRMNPVRKCKIY